jgi:hypothetical protein
MRQINIWIVLAILLALLAITRYLRDERDIRKERICADNPSASECPGLKDMKLRIFGPAHSRAKKSVSTSGEAQSRRRLGP